MSHKDNENNIENGFIFMEKGKIVIGITHGDINGIGYEVMLKALSEPMMTDFFIPVIFLISFIKFTIV